jgi:hypothetical protein
MAQQDERQVAHRPGAISKFFVAKAGIFAAVFWIWLMIIALSNDSVTGWHLFALGGAVTTTLVGVILGVRLALQANAAERHAELKKYLVEISWNTAYVANSAESSGNVVQFPTPVNDSGGWPSRQAQDSGGWSSRPDGGDRDRRR